MCTLQNYVDFLSAKQGYIESQQKDCDGLFVSEYKSRSNIFQFLYEFKGHRFSDQRDQSLMKIPVLHVPITTVCISVRDLLPLSGTLPFL